MDGLFQEYVRHILRSGLDTLVTLTTIPFAGILGLGASRRAGDPHMDRPSGPCFSKNLKVVILSLVIAREITKHMIAMRKSPSIPALAAPRARGIFVGTYNNACECRPHEIYADSAEARGCVGIAHTDDG